MIASSSSLLVRAIFCGSLVFSTTSSLTAQTDSAPPPPAVSRGALVRGAVVTVLATGAMVPLDRPIARRMQAARDHGGSFANHTASVVNNIGDPGFVIAPIGMFAAGWVTHDHPLFDVGLRATESVGLSGVIGVVIKDIAGRARPGDHSTDADDFAAGAGFKHESRTSFPSGHTTVSFAFATAVTLGTKQYAPQYTRRVGIAMYSIATAVGVARLYTNHHWASDVAMGAGLGTVSGLFVEQYTANHAGTKATGIRRLFPTAMMPVSSRAVAVAWQY